MAFSARNLNVASVVETRFSHRYRARKRQRSITPTFGSNGSVPHPRQNVRPTTITVLKIEQPNRHRLLRDEISSSENTSSGSRRFIRASIAQECRQHPELRQADRSTTNHRGPHQCRDEWFCIVGEVTSCEWRLLVVPSLRRRVADCPPTERRVYGIHPTHSHSASSPTL